MRCADHADFHAAVIAYLAHLPKRRIHDCAVAIANPVSGDHVRMTNYHWQFSIEEMRQRLGFDNLVVVNDFTALAMALPQLLPHQRRQVGGGTPVERSVMGLIGAGTGLGVSGLIPSDQGWIALGTEGGHTSFSPRNDREIAILRHAWKTLPHVSFERLLSGPGIELIYRLKAVALLRRGCIERYDFSIAAALQPPRFVPFVFEKVCERRKQKGAKPTTLPIRLCDVILLQ
jgi:glucokinase